MKSNPVEFIRFGMHCHKALKVKGGWKVEDHPVALWKEVVWPSLIEAIESIYQGRFTIQDLATLCKGKELDLSYLFWENRKSTLAVVRLSWMQGFLRFGSKKQLDLDWIEKEGTALKKLERSLVRFPEAAELSACLREARAQWCLLLQSHR